VNQKTEQKMLCLWCYTK